MGHNDHIEYKPDEELEHEDECRCCGAELDGDNVSFEDPAMCSYCQSLLNN